MQFQDAGEYKVQVVDLQNCLYREGKININVIPPPHSSCEFVTANNTCISNLPAFGNFEYINASYYSQYPSSFTIWAASFNAGINKHIKLTFKGLNKPKPGVYKTTPFNMYEPGEGEVNMLVYNDVSSFSYKPVSGQDVYINLVNGKTQICCCGFQFYNLPASNQLTTKFTVN